MNKIKFEKILFIGLLLTVVATTVFSFDNARAQQAYSFGLDVTVKIRVCGNGIIEGEEQCDGANLAGQSCQGLGFYSGSLSCRPDCTLNVSGCNTVPRSAHGGVWTLAPLKTRVIIEGRAYPQAEVALLSDGELIALKKADSSANFKFELTEITSGIYTFSLWAKDSQGRKSASFSITANIAEEVTTTISELLLPPTIELGKRALERGEILDILGQAGPESEISIYIGQKFIGETKAAIDGKWFYSFDTADLDQGSYVLKVKALSPQGLISSFSEELVFYFEMAPAVEGICPRGDLSQDGKVNLVDFSILLHWWEKADSCADQNGDGVVNLPDFSIMMYYWTG